MSVWEGEDRLMELRELRYFLTLCETGSVTAAAGELKMTQPALSRQMRHLEEELGEPLFVREKKGIQLTEAGIYLSKRAADIVSLADRTAAEFPQEGKTISGSLRIGAGESPSILYTVRIVKRLREKYPGIQVDFSNAGSRDVQASWLESGLIDFALLSVVPLTARFANIKLPLQDTWGLLMRKDDPLAAKPCVTAGDLRGLPLLAGRSENFRSLMSGWLGYDFRQLNLIGTSFLMTSTEALVSEKVACAIIREGIMNEGIRSEVCFRPFFPAIHSNLYLVWPSGRKLTRIQELFLKEIRS